MAGDPIKVEGLSQLRKSLQSIDKDAPKALRLVFNSAADLIVAEARPKIPSRTGRARSAVKVRSTQTQARIAGGSKKIPYYPWLDFGGKAGRGRKMSRPFLKNGRYIYDAYFRNRDRFQADLSDELENVVKQAGLDVD